MACLRNRDRPPSKQFPEVLALGDAAFDFKFEDSELLDKMIGDDTREKYPEKYTQHCWLVECRGCVGETVFHVCFLMGTPVHMHLAKRLLKHFPLLLNDVYLSEEYYGENVLHMAAVAEDPSIVKASINLSLTFTVIMSLYTVQLTVQYSAVQYTTVQYSAVQYTTAQYSILYD